MVSAACRPHGLSPSELRVLATLHIAGDRGASPTEIRRLIVQTSGGLTATLHRLEERGWVERHPDPEDGRGRLVAITASGATVYEGALAAVVARYEQVMGAFDLGAMTDVVRELVTALEGGTDATSTSGRSLAAALEDR